jgi:hypothetical protein
MAFVVAPGFHWVAVQWGIWRAGGVAVPLPLNSTRRGTSSNAIWTVTVTCHVGRHPAQWPQIARYRLEGGADIDVYGGDLRLISVFRGCTASQRLCGGIHRIR